MRRWRILAIVLLLLFFGGYAFTQARVFLLGPRLLVVSPENNAEVRRARLVISGSAKNVAAVLIEGREVALREDGTFRESLLLAPGYSTIEIQARDKFGASVRERREVFYAPH
ncbi:MAG: hypothetical protein HYU35_01820 [Parcubacteria group bacterium]|nr:hypothetical protein [Parcubacteria group bacterium]